MSILQTASIRSGASSQSSGGGDGYQIEKSLRFNNADQSNLERTPGTKGNTRAWTISVWVKRAMPDGADKFFMAGDTSDETGLRFDSDALHFYRYDHPSYAWQIKTNALFRDPSAWYHITAVYDSTNSVEADRLRLFVNGERQTSFSTASYPSQNTESTYNTAIKHNLGKLSNLNNTESFDGYLSDAYFIDGLVLSPAAFGSFDSTGVWNPKAFALPAPNTNKTWSGMLTGLDDGSAETVTTPTKAFDGVPAGNDYAKVGASGSGTNPTLIFTPSSAIENVNELVAVVHAGGSGSESYVQVNDGDWINIYDKSTSSPYYFDLTEYIGSDRKLTKLATKRTGSTSAGWGPAFYSIHINGVQLVDGQTDASLTTNNPHDGTVWSSFCTSSSGGTSPGSFQDLFSGSGGAGTGEDGFKCKPDSDGHTCTFIPSTAITGTKIEIRAYCEGTKSATNLLEVNGSSKYEAVQSAGGDANAAFVWVDVGTSIDTTNGVKWGRQNATNETCITAIRVDGHILRDACQSDGGGRNGFHFKFNDTSTNAALGKTSINDGKIAESNGGLPFYNTTDNYGAVKGSGYRADSSAGTTDGTGLVFAMPGDVLTDEHDEVNTGSSAQTVTNTGTVTNSTTQSKYYGTAIKLAGKNSGQRLVIDGGADFQFGTGDFTIEAWVWCDPDSTNSADGGSDVGIAQISTDSNGYVGSNSNTIAIIENGGGSKIYAANGSQSGTVNATRGTWNHWAVVRKSSTTKLYINGSESKSVSDSTNYTGQYLAIGTYYTSTRTIDGYINDFRIYKGVAKYSSAFKPSKPNDFTVNNLSHNDGGVVVGSATGGKPIRQTTDDPNYGQTGHASNLNADSNDSNLVLAIPFKQDQEYSAGTESGGSLWSGDYWYFVFEGNETNHIYSNDDNNPVRLTFPNPITVTGLITVFGSNGSNSAQAAGKDVCRFGYNDGSTSADIDLGSVLANAATWHTATGSDGWNTVEWIEIEKKSGGQGPILKSIKMDGDYLVDKYARDVSHTIRGSGSEKLMTLTSTNMVRNQKTDAKYYGSCLDFAGSSANQDYITAAATSSDFTFGTGNFTIECWYNFNTYDSNSGDILFGQPDPSSNAGNFVAYIAGSHIYFRWGGNPNYTNITNINNYMTAGTWHHIAIVRQGTGSGQTAIYIDGVNRGTCTVDGNLTGNAFSLGYWSGQSYINKGKMQDYRIYKGVAKYTSNFTVPVSPVPENQDSLVDTPTNYTDNSDVVHGNYCTINPLDTDNAGSYISQGNLKIGETGHNYRTAGFTLQPKTGKWYYEATISSFDTSDSRPLIGVCDATKKPSDRYKVNSAGNYLINFWGGGVQRSDNNTQTNISAMAQRKAGDVLQFAIDYDAKKIWIGSNNEWIAADGDLDGNPAAGSNETFGSATFLSGGINMWCGTYTVFLDLNFGLRDWAKTCPSGFKALCAVNLDDTFSGDELNNPSKYFDVITYTGDGTGGGSNNNLTTNRILPLNFRPEFGWVKSRESTSQNDGHVLVDVVRTAGNVLLSNTNAAADDHGSSGMSIDFHDTGLGVAGTNNGYSTNVADETYVAWCWDAGTTAVTPSSSYDITPDAQWVNATAGFSITKYEGNGTADQRIPHGQSVKPDWAIIKKITASGNGGSWMTKHVGLSADRIVTLDNPEAQNTDSSWYGIFKDHPDQLTVKVSTNDDNRHTNEDGMDYILYAWAAIPGYSAFGLYEGGSDPTFIYTGFRPKFVIIKCRSHTDSWVLYDGVRDKYNVIEDFLQANNNDAEATGNANKIDILSNGFAIRGAQVATAGSGKDYIYCAFAEHPFKTARAK